MMKLWAIADIHLSYKSNREEWAKLEARGPEDGLILAGDGAHMILKFGYVLC
jgi:predicted phosphodiesterase